MSRVEYREGNIAVIGVGSNIDPELNTQRAKDELCTIGDILGESSFVYTKPLLYSEQPDFLNGALLIKVDQDLGSLERSFKEIEAKLGRVRGANRNGPRPIDLDILVYNGTIVDEDIHERDFLKDSILELMPDFPL